LQAVFFITHPDVAIDRSVPVPDWPLNERGRARLRGLLTTPWMRGVRQIFASDERKARDAAQILAEGLGIEGYTVVDGLSENDRSATGYLPQQEFEATVDAFFAQPQTSVRGWEPAAAAQARIIRAPGHCSIAILPECRSTGVTTSPRQMAETGSPSIRQHKSCCSTAGVRSTQSRHHVA